MMVILWLPIFYHGILQRNYVPLKHDSLISHSIPMAPNIALYMTELLFAILKKGVLHSLKYLAIDI